MANPKVPPEIAKKIAAMAKNPPGPVPAGPRPAPGAAPRAAAPAAPARAAPKPASGGVMGKVAAVGWVLALAAGAAAVGEYYYFDDLKQAALDEQAAGYEARLAQLQADSAAALKKVQDDAAAAQMVMQTELDFQKMPELPLETTFRNNQVLYVESRLDEVFDCKVRLYRPSTEASRELDFSIKARTYQDLAAIDTWLFERGDKVEFVKPGYKPRSLVVP